MGIEYVDVESTYGHLVINGERIQDNISLVVKDDVIVASFIITNHNIEQLSEILACKEVSAGIKLGVGREAILLYKRAKIRVKELASGVNEITELSVEISDLN